MGCTASTTTGTLDPKQFGEPLTTYPDPAGKKTVVIVGASFAGFAAAEFVWDEANVVIIDQNDHFEYNPFSIKAASEGSATTDKLFQPYENFAKGYNGKFKFVQARLLNVLADAHTIDVENTKTRTFHKINYDVLVIATGFTYHAPIKTEAAYTVTQRK